ncbi:PREDICTED: glutathione S-transferase 1-1-like [Papilio polytes]|uniref:glutathione S-transferase 1-1-like n=1 Tax=Papilio polytes TaxID=76194 RepID=UPI0006763113|nr:PREDICTED: glutathione S-transferase 1-1-like [Papilio polytes]
MRVCSGLKRSNSKSEREPLSKQSHNSRSGAIWEQINPQHSVPTLVDDGFVLWESRAICRYLVYKYGNDSSLYPKDPKTRATVDQRLDFDLGTFYPSLGEYFYAQVFNGVPEDPQKLAKLEEVLEILNTFLEDSKFAAGEELTLADLCLVTTVSTIDAIGISLAKYPNIERWFELVKKIAPDYEEANGKGAELNKQMAAKLRSK